MLFSILWAIIGVAMIVYDRFLATDLALAIPGTFDLFGKGTYIDAGLVFIAWGIVRWVWGSFTKGKKQGDKR